MKPCSGTSYNCALSLSNTVKCWGKNAHAQLGLGDTDNRGDQANEMGDKLPEVDLGESFQPMTIVSGTSYNCALSLSNTVKCWGKNAPAQLGLGDTDNRGDQANEMGDKLPELRISKQTSVVV
eukprot:820651_1